MPSTPLVAEFELRLSGEIEPLNTALQLCLELVNAYAPPLTDEQRATIRRGLRTIELVQKMQASRC